MVVLAAPACVVHNHRLRLTRTNTTREALTRIDQWKQRHSRPPEHSQEGNLACSRSAADWQQPKRRSGRSRSETRSAAVPPKQQRAANRGSSTPDPAMVGGRTGATLASVKRGRARRMLLAIV